ncbi:MAG TPA: GTPase [Segeticoccus sp.]|uniref:GTPase n=1 Tax=Segeticoccus sp. TaxID=2706531 RepID=UPI002D7E1AA6|nr:GTPase [Segeticoccus sp.]HET8598717.1 GTPase [Segeticoccus sp.]
MSARDLLRRATGTKPAVSRADLESRAEALGQALELGADQLDAGAVATARAVAAKVGERTGIAGGRTVVALAGATGSGKSSLFNRLVGAEVAQVGARRPTTAKATAAVWGREPVTPLLDWLGVARRHEVRDAAGAGAGGPGVDAGADARSDGVDAAEGATDLDGLVLLDLPDFDSRVRSHREEVDRLLELVDVFVWVTDPQKYADALLHEDYVRQLSDHGATMLAVLNQADRLSPEGVAACQQDLRRLLGEDGLHGVEVVLTSAATGAGLVELRHRVAQAVQTRNAAEQRLLGDVRHAARELRAGVADSEPRVGEEADEELVEALSRAAGIPVVLKAVERDYRNEAWSSTGWPFTRWARALRPDPLKRLRLTPGRGRAAEGSAGVSAQDVRAALGRSSLPPPTPAARSAVSLAVRRLGDRASEGLPPRWADEVIAAAGPFDEDLSDHLDQAVVGTSLRVRRPRWWGLCNVLQWLFALTAVAGAVWLVVLAVLGWLQMGTYFQPPLLGPVPWPVVLLGGGLVCGLLLAVLARALARVGARRRRRVIARRLGGAIDGVARARIVAPVRAVLEAHRGTRERLDAALR